MLELFLNDHEVLKTGVMFSILIYSINIYIYIIVIIFHSISVFNLFAIKEMQFW